MICTSIQHKDLKQILDILESGEVEMAEIRLDLCPDLSDEDIEMIFSSYDLPLIATCRISSDLPAVESERRLGIAVDAGARYVDIETEAPAPMGKRLRRKAKSSGTTVIRSFHDFEGTPDYDGLSEAFARCRQFGGDICKVVTMASEANDAASVLRLYEEAEPGTLVAFCMGEAGLASRLECLKLGAPFTYASLSEDDATACGQPVTSELNSLIYGNFRTFVLPPTRMPASKSFAQRAIIAAALARGTSHLRGYSPCDDSRAAIAAARALGAEVREGEVITVKGIGAGPDTLALKTLHTGESGLLTRLAIPLLAVLGDGGPVCVTGEKTLVQRPLSGANDIMAAFGVVLTNDRRRETNPREIYVPLRISGSLMPGRAEISGRGGSQLISGLLMALPLAAAPSDVTVTEPRSIPYMFITQDILQRFGIRSTCEMEGDEEFMQSHDWSFCTGINFKIKGGQHYRAADMDIEADWSSAAPFLVAGAIFGSATLNGLDTSSLQADLTIMDILLEAGAAISQTDTDYVESVSRAASEAGVSPSTGEIHVTRAPLNCFEVDLNNAPDLFPVTAVLACFCEGTSYIGGVGRLANKESDRGAAILQMLTQMGADARIEGDDMIVEGHSLCRRLLTGEMLKGGHFTSMHDHRMVMALKVAELGADGPVIIDDTACVAKSYPDFLEDWNSALTI